MTSHHLAIQRTGLVTAVGLTAAECAAAFRSKIANPAETRFSASGGEWIMAHPVPLDPPCRGLGGLVRMAVLATEEALQDLPRTKWTELPMLLCVAEADRPGRTLGLNDRLLLRIQEELGVEFAPESALIARGRVSVAHALSQARALIGEGRSSQVVVVATDSLLSWPTLSAYERQDRLLSARNADGFMPGEAAGALLVGRPSGIAGELVCTGIGFGREAAHIASDEPLRGDGLTETVLQSLLEAARRMQDMDCRVSDISGEQYYFKEAALAFARTLRGHTEKLDLWHPAECTGEVGAAAGAVAVAAVAAACDKQYAEASNILAHMANDAGDRAALVLQYRVPS